MLSNAQTLVLVQRINMSKILFMAPTLSRFSRRSLWVLELSEEEARRLGHCELGTEHLLLGLLAVGTAPTSQFFKSKGITLQDVRREVVKLNGRSYGTQQASMTLTPEAARVIEQAITEADQLGGDAVEPVHILLSLSREDESQSQAVRVLKNLPVRG